METSLTRNEKFIGLFAFGVITGFAAVFIQISLRSNSTVSQVETRHQINYQMARPDESYSEYTLNGREIDQSYEGLKHREAHQNGKAPVVAQKDKLKTEAERKVAEAAKKKTEAAQKAATVTKAQVAEQNRKSEQQSRANRSEPSAKDPEQQPEISPMNKVVAPAANRNESKPAEDPEADKNKKKTFGDWRKQIFAQPTREMIDSFLAAYRKGEITATEVQALAQDLVDQNDDKLKGLGLYTLRATPSLASLSQLVHIEAQMNASFKSYIEQAYLSYLQPQNVNHLNQALLTKDKVLILKALNLLGTNLQKVAKGDNSAFVDPRNGREAGAGSTITMNSFSVLMPALTSLGASQDQELAPLAQQVLAYMQSNNVATLN